MTPIHVTLVVLVEKPEKLMGPEWRKEGAIEGLSDDCGIVLHAEADIKEEPEKPMR